MSHTSRSARFYRDDGPAVNGASAPPGAGASCYTPRASCSSWDRRSGSTRSSRTSAPAASGPSSSRATPGSTRRSRSRSRTARRATRTISCRSRGCSPPSTTRTSWGSSPRERVEGAFFIVMDYVKGESLEAVLDREKSLDTPRALNYAVQILKGVEHAHEAQILHRDLRPANVLISESGVCKVAGLRHVAPARALARHHRDREPALHGSRGVSGPRRARLRHLLGWRDALPDAHGRPALLQPEPGADRASRGPGPLRPPSCATA